MKLKTLDGVSVEPGDWAWYITVNRDSPRVVRNLVELPFNGFPTVSCYSTEQAALYALRTRIDRSIEDAKAVVTQLRGERKAVRDRIAALDALEA